MADFNVRSDSVNVEHIMEQIRARIREKRGVDYTEAQIRELATARLEKFLDPGPGTVRADLLQEFLKKRAATDVDELTGEDVDETVLFETHRPWLRAVRRILRPILKLFLNTKALAALSAPSKAEVSRRALDRLTFELMHNMVVEMTRLSIEVKNLTMRVESMQSRLEFNERRARALESAGVYKPSEPEPIVQAPRPPVRDVRPPVEFRPRQDVQPTSATQPSGGAPVPGAPDGPGQRSRRRRRRRGRRGGAAMPPGSQPGPLGQPAQSGQPGQPSPAGDSMPPQEHEYRLDDASAEGPDEGGADTDPDPQ